MSKRDKPTPLTIRQGYTKLLFKPSKHSVVDKCPYPFKLSEKTSPPFIDDVSPWIIADGWPFDLPGESFNLFSSEPLLHRKFADIDEDNPEKIIEFVDRYGFLNVGSSFTHDKYESLARWKFEILEMRGMLDLWRIYCSNSLKRLMPYIHTYNTGEREFTRIELPWRKQMYHIYNMNTTDSYPWEPSWQISDLRRFIVEVINEKIAGHIVYELNPTDLAVIIEPMNLFSAMWSMFLIEEIVGNNTVRQCKMCQNWFMPTDERQIYCEGKCKVMAHRKGLSKSIKGESHERVNKKKRK